MVSQVGCKAVIVLFAGVSTHMNVGMWGLGGLHAQGTTSYYKAHTALRVKMKNSQCSTLSELNVNTLTAIPHTAEETFHIV